MATGILEVEKEEEQEGEDEKREEFAYAFYSVVAFNVRG